MLYSLDRDDLDYLKQACPIWVPEPKRKAIDIKKFKISGTVKYW